MKTPYTAISVATAWVPNTAINKIFAGRMDQKGPRVRVRNMVRCPATDIFKYIMSGVRMVEMENVQRKPEQAKNGDRPYDAQNRGNAEHQRMFHASACYCT